MALISMETHEDWIRNRKIERLEGKKAELALRSLLNEIAMASVVLDIARLKMTIMLLEKKA